MYGWLAGWLAGSGAEGLAPSRLTTTYRIASSSCT
eukprot:SAG25_NODE_1117_length_3903_cov_24.641316_1_plen_34_part_10